MDKPTRGWVYWARDLKRQMVDRVFAVNEVDGYWIGGFA